MHALLSIVGVFALILGLARYKIPLALAIIIGALATGLLFGQGISGTLRIGLLGLVQQRTLGLLLITALQLMLSMGMEHSGQMQRIVALARAALRRPAVAMAALPALIGLLPMPGGALFSAPMVASAADVADVPAEKLSAINYWYRHIWEHWWPVYPGVILAMTLTGLSFADFALTQFPLGLIMAATGLLIFRHTHPNLHAALPAPPPGTKRKLLVATASIWLIIMVAVPVTVVVQFVRLPAWPAEFVTRFLPVGLGLGLAVWWTMRLNRLTLATTLGLCRNRTVGSLLLLVLSVMVFQYMLSRANAASQIAGELQALHVPLTLVIVILPFVAGAVTGLAVGFVGTSFPIVLPLMALIAPDGSIRGLVVLAYACGHLGQMVSPLHLCYVVSNRYFKTPFGPVYRELVPSLVLVALLTAAYVVLLRLAGI